MGMYTEFHFNVKLKANTPKEIISILNYALNNKKVFITLPEHEFFDTSRWRSMLRSDSSYFNSDTNSTLRQDKIDKVYFLCIRCNLKNYDNEIELFIAWIKPYLNESEGNFLGFSRYEETQIPTLIYM